MHWLEHCKHAPTRASSVRFPPDSARAGTGAAREQRLPIALQVLQVLFSRRDGSGSDGTAAARSGENGDGWLALEPVIFFIHFGSVQHLD